jgi:hypothetical protein
LGPGVVAGKRESGDGRRARNEPRRKLPTWQGEPPGSRAGRPPRFSVPAGPWRSALCDTKARRSSCRHLIVKRPTKWGRSSRVPPTPPLFRRRRAANKRRPDAPQGSGVRTSPWAGHRAEPLMPSRSRSRRWFSGGERGRALPGHSHSAIRDERARASRLAITRRTVEAHAGYIAVMNLPEGLHLSAVGPGVGAVMFDQAEALQLLRSRGGTLPIRTPSVLQMCRTRGTSPWRSGAGPSTGPALSDQIVAATRTLPSEVARPAGPGSVQRAYRATKTKEVQAADQDTVAQVRRFPQEKGAYFSEPVPVCTRFARPSEMPWFQPAPNGTSRGDPIITKSPEVLGKDGEGRAAPQFFPNASGQVRILSPRPTSTRARSSTTTAAAGGDQARQDQQHPRGGGSGARTAAQVT